MSRVRLANPESATLADHFTDLAVMNKTLEYPFDNSSLSVHDQQLIRQACGNDRHTLCSDCLGLRARLVCDRGLWSCVVLADRAALSFTDRNIGEVVNHLVDLGMYDDTIVALWG